LLLEEQMTRLEHGRRLRRETGALYRSKPLVVELMALSMRIRPKGAKWGYEVDYESIFVLGARKEAERSRTEARGRSSREQGKRRRRP
jgi:hypothetical protein